MFGHRWVRFCFAMPGYCQWSMGITQVVHASGHLLARTLPLLSRQYRYGHGTVDIEVMVVVIDRHACTDAGLWNERSTQRNVIQTTAPSHANDQLRGPHALAWRRLPFRSRLDSGRRWCLKPSALAVPNYHYCAVLAFRGHYQQNYHAAAAHCGTAVGYTGGTLCG
jgi:hypothetical protein